MAETSQQLDDLCLLEAELTLVSHIGKLTCAALFLDLFTGYTYMYKLFGFILKGLYNLFNYITGCIFLLYPKHLTQSSPAQLGV